jgi:hypothetical protein
MWFFLISIHQNNPASHLILAKRDDIQQIARSAFDLLASEAALSLQQ